MHAFSLSACREHLKRVSDLLWLVLLKPCSQARYPALESRGLRGFRTASNAGIRLPGLTSLCDVWLPEIQQTLALSRRSPESDAAHKGMVLA